MASTTPPAIDGLVSLSSPCSVAETIDRPESQLRVKGATIFARLDHCAAAARSGLTMRAAQVLIFGNPLIGTPVMNVVPTVAIDLPFKVLAWEDADGKVWLSHNTAEYLALRHHIPDDVAEALEAVAHPIAAAVQPILK